MIHHHIAKGAVLRIPSHTKHIQALNKRD
jgi:hypothetical protein